MRDLSIFKGIIAIAICLLPYFVFGQSTKKVVRYDDWSITVTANANRNSSKDGSVSPNFVPTGPPWNRKILTFFFQNGTPDISGDGGRGVVRQAFTYWSAQTDLAFLETCSAGTADIIVLWASGNHGDGSSFDGSGGTLAHTFPPFPTGGQNSGDMHFDEAETWVNQIRGDTSQPIDLLTVAIHELGHALGLDHTTVAGSVMLEYYTGSHRYLGSDDIAGIKSLYGQTKTGSTMVSGNNFFCGTSALTLQNVPSSATVNWSVSPTYSFASSSGSGSTANLNASGQWGSGYTITYNLQTACGSTTVSRINLWAGNPGLQQMTYGTAGTGQTNTVSTINVVSPNTWYIIRTNTELAQLSSAPTWNPNTSVNGYVSATGEYRLNLSPGQSVNLTVGATNSCGSSTRTITYTAQSSFRAYPNPATDVTYVEFDNANFAEALPDRVDLLSESSTKPISSINVQDSFKTKTMKEGNKIEFNVKDLPRGTYYLHIIDDKGKKVDAIRVKLN